MNHLTVVAHIEEPSARVRRAEERVFRAAVRHSRHVRWMRVGLPISIVITVGLVAGVATVLDPLRKLARLPIDIGSVIVSGSKITMQAPRLSGFTRDSRPYEVTARAAAQDIMTPDKLELRDIHASMQRPDKTTIVLTARNGLYESKADKLFLQEDIVVKTSSGDEGYLSEATIEIRSGNIVSEKPVELKMTKGTISSNRMEVVNSGEIMRFDGSVVMTIVMGETGKAAPR